MTPHIGAKKEEIAKTVIMPGDPMRAKHIAENYLTDYKLVNEIRGMYAYTGYYDNKLVTVMASGMGMASMGIYSYELFKEYDVNNIIRIGTCGAYTDTLKLRDVILVESTYAVTDYDEMVAGTNSSILYSSQELNEKIKLTAKRNNINITTGRTHCTDAFYLLHESTAKYYYEKECLAVEMEAFSLFQNANITNKQATCILTVSDNLITGDITSPEERQTSFNKMVELALKSIE